MEFYPSPLRESLPYEQSFQGDQLIKCDRKMIYLFLRKKRAVPIEVGTTVFFRQHQQISPGRN